MDLVVICTQATGERDKKKQRKRLNEMGER